MFELRNKKKNQLHTLSLSPDVSHLIFGSEFINPFKPNELSYLYR